MKIQSLAIIFIIIILPISIVLSEYLQAQIDTITLQSSYDSKLITSTYDAVKAYQMNSTNSISNDVSATKIRNIEASANTFLTSVATNFIASGSSVEDVKSYVPAIVYCLYDGYYIYSPYENDIDGVYAGTNPSLESQFTYQNDETIYGLKPYIYYSCRYVHAGGTDVTITYSLDNYITVQGKLRGVYVNESGYYMTGIAENGGTITYNGTVIKNDEGALIEQIYDVDANGGAGAVKEYPYIKLNGTKYYYDKDYTGNGANLGGIFYITNSGEKNYNQAVDEPTINKYKAMIENNSSAYKFYKNALDFTNKINSGDLSALKEITFSDAIDPSTGQKISSSLAGFTGDTKIFKETINTTKPQDTDSNFSEHRTAVIRYSIEKNLTTAIANYNNNFSQNSSAFAMPNLSETDWYKIINNISVISFLQGISIGGKVYNGYAVVTNNKNEDYVSDNSIYMLTSDNIYHRYDEDGLSGAMTGFVNMDFERHTFDDENYYYPQQRNGVIYKYC